MITFPRKLLTICNYNSTMDCIEVIAFKGIAGQHTGYNLVCYLTSLCEHAGILTRSSSKVSFIPIYY